MQKIFSVVVTALLILSGCAYKEKDSQNKNTLANYGGYKVLTASDENYSLAQKALLAAKLVAIDEAMIQVVAGTNVWVKYSIKSCDTCLSTTLASAKVFIPLPSEKNQTMTVDKDANKPTVAAAGMTGGWHSADLASFNVQKAALKAAKNIVLKEVMQQVIATGFKFKVLYSYDAQDYAAILTTNRNDAAKSYDLDRKLSCNAKVPTKNKSDYTLAGFYEEWQKKDWNGVCQLF